MVKNKSKWILGQIFFTLGLFFLSCLNVTSYVFRKKIPAKAGIIIQFHKVMVILTLQPLLPLSVAAKYGLHHDEVADSRSYPIQKAE